MTEKQTGRAPWASKSLVGETEAEREEAGVGGHHRWGRTAGGAQTRSHTPPGQARGSVFLPSSPLGAQEPGAPQPAVGMGGRHLGEEGGMVRLCSAARQIQC